MPWTEELEQLLIQVYPKYGIAGYDIHSVFKDNSITTEAYQKKAERLRLKRIKEVSLEEPDVDEGKTRITFSATTQEDRVRIIPFGDIHLGSPNNTCNVQKVVRELKYIEDTDDTYMIGMGDYVDNPQAMPQKSGPNIYKASMSNQQQYEMILNLFQPLADKKKIIGLLSGNHEDYTSRSSGRYVVRDLCRELNVTQLGPGSNINFYANKMKYVFYGFHGSGGSRMASTKLGSLLNATRDIWADVYLEGHLHQLVSTKTGHLVEGVLKKSYHVLTGHFLDWDGGYAQLFGLSPSPTGVAKITLFTDRHDVHVSI